MGAWTSNELDTIGAAEELHLASVRRDGTLRNPVTMWVVRLGDDVGNDVDAAYRAKYSRRYPSIVPAIVAREARAATLKLVPR